jgi:hypothetical protein
VRTALSEAVRARRAALGQVTTASAAAAHAARAAAEARTQTKEAADALGRAEDELTDANAAVESARDKYSLAVRGWVAGLQEVALDIDAVDVSEPDVVRDVVDAAVTAAHVAIADLRAAVTESKNQHDRERGRLQSEYDARASEPQPARPIAPRRTTARVGRHGAAVFELVQFVSGAE